MVNGFWNGMKCNEMEVWNGKIVFEIWNGILKCEMEIKNRKWKSWNGKCKTWNEKWKTWNVKWKRWNNENEHHIYISDIDRPFFMTATTK